MTINVTRRLTEWARLLIMVPVLPDDVRAIRECMGGDDHSDRKCDKERFHRKPLPQIDGIRKSLLVCDADHENSLRPLAIHQWRSPYPPDRIRKIAPVAAQQTNEAGRKDSDIKELASARAGQPIRL